MYDQWVEEVEEGKMVGLLMVDLSSAFDMVEVKTILMEKLKLLGLDNTALHWMKSFSTGRRQSVCIDGKLSPALDLVHGLAQGSVLAPLLYVLYTCDVPGLIHDHSVSISTPQVRCEKCGSLVSYIDDNSISVPRSSAIELSETLSSEYKKIA